VNYYPFHIGDYLSATRHLSWEEDAAFRRLLDTYYTTEKPLPTDLRSVCRLVLATTESQRESVRIVLEEFFDLTETGWVNHRADAEIAEMHERQKIAKEKANKRWDKHRSERSNAAAMLQHEEIDAAASKTDADAMLPTPTPTPTPTPKGEDRKTARASARTTAPPQRPDSIPESVWQDFQAIRKAKRAPLTDTALVGMEREATKAGLSLEAAIRFCCEAGWQAFNAGWYAERQAKLPQKTSPQRAPEPAWRAEQRDRVRQFAPGVAAHNPVDSIDFFEVEAKNVTAIAVG